MCLIDPGLPFFVGELLLLFPPFKRRVFPVNGIRQIRRPFDIGFVGQLGGGGGLGVEFAV